MLSSLSDNSFRQYDVCIKKWWSFCLSNGVDIYCASVPTVIYFLTNLYNSGSQYGTLNTCRAALSLLLGPTISKDDRLQRFFKGVFRLRPSLPKYNYTWDTNIVLDGLSEWYPNDTLSFNQLSKKTVTLLALTTAHRLQTLSYIKIENIEQSTERLLIKIPDLIKTSRPGVKQPVLVLPFFREKVNICPATTLLAYVEKSNPLRRNKELFIGLTKPHKPVGSQTLSRWVKSTLSECGLDTSMFTAHSTRHAATSRAHALGVSIDNIRNTAGWSGNSTTFAKYYNRTIITDNSSSLARALIDNNNNT